MKSISIESATRTYDIITFGDMCADLIVSGGDLVPRFGQVEQLVDDYALEMGGSCCIFACQAAKLGLRVGILGRVGDDAFGQLILDRLRTSGVDTRHVIVEPTLKTGLGIALTQQGDRAILTYLGSICAIQLDDVTDAFLASARHLHHGSFFLHTRLRPQMPQIFERARMLELSTSLDTNWDPDNQWNSSLAEVLPLTDVCMPNEQEVLRIGGCTRLEDAVAQLRARVPLLVLKRGAAGATLYARDASYEGPALPPVTGGTASAPATASTPDFWLAGCAAYQWRTA